jgi:NADH dehydrogenase
MLKPRVVIIGGGYTSIWTRKFLKVDVNVTVICDKPYHSFHGWTTEAMTGILPIESRQTQLKEIFSKDRIIIGSALGISPEKREVYVHSEGRSLSVSYDHLVIANGSSDRNSTVTGMEEFAFSVKAPGAVRKMKTQLETLNCLGKHVFIKSEEIEDGWKTVVIAGAGLAGIELAGNIAEMDKSLRVVLVHSGEQIGNELLPRFKKLARYCQEQLEKQGVELYLNCRITEVSAEGISLSNGNYKKFIRAKTVISSIGQKASILPGTEDFCRNEKALIQTDVYLRVKKYPNIWTGGDTAQVMRPNGQSSPANALWAIMHGKWIGQNLSATIQDKRLKAFNYPGLGQAGSLGIGKGFAELYGIQFTGWIAWLLRFGFFLLFHPTRKGAIRVFLNWLEFALNGRKLEKYPIQEENLPEREYLPLIGEKH